jgi:hypothetical protein
MFFYRTIRAGPGLAWCVTSPGQRPARRAALRRGRRPGHRDPAAAASTIAAASQFSVMASACPKMTGAAAPPGIQDQEHAAEGRHLDCLPELDGMNCPASSRISMSQRPRAAVAGSGASRSAVVVMNPA